MFSESLKQPIEQLGGHSSSGESSWYLLRRTLLKLRPTALSYGTSLTVNHPHFRN